jgi:uncharacterized delta-60 repeat protein
VLLTCRRLWVSLRIGATRPKRRGLKSARCLTFQRRPVVECLERRDLPTPTLTVSLSEVVLREDNGPNAVSGVVTRHDAEISTELIVSLASSDTSELTVPATVTIPAGANSVGFEVTVEDDTLLDGVQHVQVTASAAGFESLPALPGAVGPDPTFGTNGSALIPLTSQPREVVELSNGQILVAAELALMRYNSDGSLDTNFGDGGLAVPNYPAGTQSANSRALFELPNGGLLVAGEQSDGTTWNWMFAAFDADGSVDSNFGTNGHVLQPFANYTELRAAAFQADGKLVVAGWTLQNDDSVFVVGRFNTDMTLDTSFGTNGLVFSDLGYGGSNDMSLAIQPDGHILVAGKSGSLIAILRYDSAGVLDNSFSGYGATFVSFPGLYESSSYFAGMALQSDGRIVVGGYTGYENSFAFTRLNSDGEIDPSFGDSGTRLINFGSPNDYLREMLVAPDDSIIAVGESRHPGVAHAAIAKLTPNGHLDSSFDEDGKLLVTDSEASTDIDAASLTSDGKLVVVGNAGWNSLVGRYVINSGVPGRHDLVDVRDHESLSLTFTTSTFSEAAGPSASIGTVTRSNTNQDEPLTVHVSSFDTSEFTVPWIVTIPADAASATFAINAVDDTIVDGTQSKFIVASASAWVNVTEEVYYVHALETLHVTDNENTAPTVSDQTFFTNEDTLVSGQVVGSDSNGDTLTFSVVSGPSSGSLSLQSDGHLSYTPAANFSGTASFTFRANDGVLNSGTATATINISAVNDAPVVDDQSFSAAENSANGTSVGTVSASDVDAGDTRTFSILSGNTGGAFAISSAGAITVANSAALDFETTPTFLLSVQVVDAGGLSATTGITIQLTDVAETKFFVVDATADKTYRYAANGSALANSTLNTGNADSRGVTADSTGTKYWVIDSNKTVYVYSASGSLLGSWNAGTINTPTGIATDGTHIWITDSKNDRVYRYDNAANRLSGSQTATSSFALSVNNKNSSDLTTDGTSVWVIESSTTDQVFKYSMSGTLLGSWSIDAANTSPTGITIDPANVSNIWIVDNGTDRVYQYNSATTRTSGSQSANAQFVLTTGNTDPQGIADPPPPALRIEAADAPAAIPSSRLALVIEPRVGTFIVNSFESPDLQDTDGFGPTAPSTSLAAHPTHPHPPASSSTCPRDVVFSEVFADNLDFLDGMTSAAQTKR